MNNVFVYCEIDKFTVEEVSFELLTKGRKLANELIEELASSYSRAGLDDTIVITRSNNYNAADHEALIKKAIKSNPNAK